MKIKMPTKILMLVHLGLRVETKKTIVPINKEEDISFHLNREATKNEDKV